MPCKHMVIIDMRPFVVYDSVYRTGRTLCFGERDITEQPLVQPDHWLDTQQEDNR